MNERQMEVIMGIVQEQLADYLSTDLTEEICGGIRGRDQRQHGAD